MVGVGATESSPTTIACGRTLRCRVRPQRHACGSASFPLLCRRSRGSPRAVQLPSTRSVTIDVQSVDIGPKSAWARQVRDRCWCLTYLENEPLSRVRKTPLYRERYVFVTSRSVSVGLLDLDRWREAAADNLCLLNEIMQNRRVLNNLASSIGSNSSPRSRQIHSWLFARMLRAAYGRASSPIRLAISLPAPKNWR